MKMTEDSSPKSAVSAEFDFEGGMPGLIGRFAKDWAAVRSYFRIAACGGDAERKIAFLQSAIQELESVDFDGLEADERIDWTLFRNFLGSAVGRERQRRAREAEVAEYLPFAEEIAGLAQRRRKGDRPGGQDIAAALNSIHTSVKQADSGVAKRLAGDGRKEVDRKERVLALRACKTIAELQEGLEEWALFYRDYDPEITWWIQKPQEDLKRALEEYVLRLRGSVLGIEENGKGEEPVVGDPIGREALCEELASEWIAYGPEELIEIAEKEWEWCKRERLRAAREMGYGDDWRAALAHINEDYVRPGEQPGLVRELALEAIGYLRANNLVTVPKLCEATWEMKMMTPERQKVNPYFTGGQTISISFPTQGMMHEEKLKSLRGNNRHFARATVQHELIPGHHLQLYMSERYRPYRKLFRTPFFVEGWALYWEMILFEKGFHNTPEGRTGALFWRIHRAARVIFSLRFHLGEMTAEDAIAYLEREVGHEHHNAVAEVRRSVSDDYPPLYQAAYLIGGLQMRALRAELVDSGNMKEKSFHDAILKQSYLPIELLRTALRGDSITKDSRCGWRFC